ncbi:hypothetical protein HRM2_p00050 (plasmid) [Desulforapulum autotrophicum HRM2]|uniref:Uncharacterized protein n=1 Tax=Desulforapulum autotrophicum (strain ATCC 43914 / DSM 3382 / VKM B-1955 / HRM2) TaxID=177437 RepID=C0QMK5_DESAH|nr:hypothetical protein HRM2_p00050 [Desulforapulum autotrophicum HRM2]
MLFVPLGSGKSIFLNIIGPWITCENERRAISVFAYRFGANLKNLNEYGSGVRLLQPCSGYVPRYEKHLRLPAIMNPGYVPCRFLFYASV